MTEPEASVTSCNNCHLPMPSGLRFCRNCGYRLGEGAAEYTETVRFQNAPPGMLPNNNAPISGPYNFAGGPAAVPYAGQGGKKRRISGTAWMFIGLLIFFVFAAGLSAVIKNRPLRIPAGGVGFMASRSYAGVDDWKTAENDAGATFECVETPGGPADKAGLVGGDIITSADGQPVHSDDEMSAIMRRTPVGKTIDIVYLRDGETKTTKMTPISREELQALARAFENRPEGRAFFGYETNATEVVAIPNTKISGVKVDVTGSGPAIIAGLKDGDVIVQFGDAPIRTEDEFQMRVRRAVPFTTIPIVLYREGQRMEIPVKVGKQE
ncbi:MAG TPA: PDZ domain-containing protein [Pyrinomonadaceae bacterium]|nr:PDZ domain-containing protein [Pyrinomonadaceae bacterium]